MSLVAALNDNVVRLEGKLLFSSVNRATTDVVAMIDQHNGELIVDFAGVTRVDSAALTFWLHCVRAADNVGVMLTAVNIPTSMLSIAELVGVRDWLPLSKTG